MLIDVNEISFASANISKQNYLGSNLVTFEFTVDL